MICKNRYRGCGFTSPPPPLRKPPLALQTISRLFPCPVPLPAAGMAGPRGSGRSQRWLSAVSPTSSGIARGAVGRARWERCCRRRWENIAMGCAGVSRKPFKHSQPQQFCSGDPDLLPLTAAASLLGFFCFFFLKQSLLLAPPTPGTAFVGDLSSFRIRLGLLGGLREPSRTPNPSGDSKLLFTLLPWSCSGALQQFLWSQGFRGCWGWGTLAGCPRAWLEIPTWLLEGGAEPLAG